MEEDMFLLKGFHLVFKIFKNALLMLMMATILFIAYRGNQPMSVPQAPQGITYFEFLAERDRCPKLSQPNSMRMGNDLSWQLGPIYSVV